MATNSNSQITETLTGNGSTGLVRGKHVDVSVSGSFDATWTIERMVNKDGTWGVVGSYTGPQERVLENAAVTSVRVTVSGYVGGSVLVKLAGDR